MPGELHEFLTRDHERLDRLLEAALGEDGSIDEPSYAQFRRGLLRHISIEERVLFPELRRRKGETAIEVELHRDHAALAALLCLPPAEEGIRMIRAILGEHNVIEEAESGLYEMMEMLAGAELSSLMERVHAIPNVPVAPYVDTPVVRRSIEYLVREATRKRAPDPEERPDGES
jgi:hypothetical protein